jgi:excisionase family DNA binding protein
VTPSSSHRFPLDPLLDAAGVAQILSVPLRSVYVLAETGRLAYYKVGRRLRFRAADVEKLLDQGHVAAERDG